MKRPFQLRYDVRWKLKYFEDVPATALDELIESLLDEGAETNEIEIMVSL